LIILEEYLTELTQKTQIKPLFKNKYILHITCLLSVLILGTVDYYTGQEYSFLIFYAIPVMYATWFGGLVPGIIYSVICLISWFNDSFNFRPALENPVLPYWNLLVQTCFFILIIFITLRLKAVTKYEKELERKSIERELKIARDVQQRFFPQHVPSFDKINLFGMCRPADSVGGDYFDYFKISKNELIITIADVSGHGISSALLMAGLVGFFRTNAVNYVNENDKLLEKTNDFVCRMTGNYNFVTIFYSVFNNKTNKLKFVNAGHNPPFLIKNGEQKVIKLESGGLLTGIIEDIKYVEKEVSLEEGDLLVLYTDGVTETMNDKNELYGEERLLNVILKSKNFPPEIVAKNIIKDVETYNSNNKQADDITLIVCKIT